MGGAQFGMDLAREERIDRRVIDGYSIEITGKDIAALRAAAPDIAPGTTVSVTFLAADSLDQRTAAAAAASELGFTPMPHLSARRVTSLADLETMVAKATTEGVARQMFLVAGDPPVPAGPFEDTISLLKTGIFERHDVRTIGIAGHPEGHAILDRATSWRALKQKAEEIAARGMATLIVTQFGFDAASSLTWLDELRALGIDAPVRIGIPGPAGIKTLLRFAAHCGVSASAGVMAKYGLSVTKLLGTAGPDRLIEELEAGLRLEHGDVKLHFYPFGGVERTIKWINDYRVAASGARTRW